MVELETDKLDLVILSQLSTYHYSGELLGHRTVEE